MKPKSHYVKQAILITLGSWVFDYLLTHAVILVEMSKIGEWHPSLWFFVGGGIGMAIVIMGFAAFTQYWEYKNDEEIEYRKFRDQTGDTGSNIHDRKDTNSQ